MTSFWKGVTAMLVITAISAVALQFVASSSSSVYQARENVRQ